LRKRSEHLFHYHFFRRKFFGHAAARARADHDHDKQFQQHPDAVKGEWPRGLGFSMEKDDWKVVLFCDEGIPVMPKG